VSDRTTAPAAAADGAAAVAGAEAEDEAGRRDAAGPPSAPGAAAPHGAAKPVRSLAGRLAITATLWVAVGLVAAGVVLVDLFADHLERSHNSQLEAWLDALVAAVEVGPGGKVGVVRPLHDPRFEIPRSGYYWQISDDSGLVLKSRSLDRREIEAPTEHTEPHMMALRGSEPTLRGLERQFSVPGSGTLHAVVATERSVSWEEIVAFGGSMAWSLLPLGLGLVVAVVVQVHIGLRPLFDLRDRLNQVRAGQAARIEGEYPAEIAPLVAELNDLLAHNAAVVDRARTYVGNLAHSMKTPLAVLANEAASRRGTLAGTVRQQVGIMRRQVDHYLVRARTAASAGILGAHVPIAPVVADLNRTLARIHAERALRIDSDIAADAVFGGERQDLEEMLGNLIDNACKWARSRVLVHARATADGVRIEVEDDGPGLSPEQRAMVFERGARLDERMPGSGLGLSIVRDIAQLYGGGVALRAASRGGLVVVLILPAPHSVVAVE
jgi:signal transduction histidine kinase